MGGVEVVNGNTDQVEDEGSNWHPENKIQKIKNVLSFKMTKWFFQKEG